MTNIIENAFDECPIIGIIRGSKPSEIVAIGEALFESGIRIMEVPLNSPSPVESIQRLIEAMGDKMVIGAGTVLSVQDVDDVVKVGGQICVSPNTDQAVIKACVDKGVEAFPGYQTPSEAFSAIQAGATWLKCFPAGSLGPSGISSLRDVIPAHIRLIAVGGVSAGNVADYMRAGCNGIGMAGSLYKPGYTAKQVGQAARQMVVAMEHWQAGQVQ
ncbi:2-dehydro-3-deoxy-6-phosphogalactonate aldolase [Paraglaciecola arctica]|uniref:2-dehydro-3-deoxy-6-phosphogalactonate aldolase n=1 Tax=Paraglaciecola arctica TaxID=1128911 RepID=UPI001C0793E6|nr:2-dehydro-3-deoxy-6-phosphogalactonate aldolase [Paraglaciecola arctica]MBU3005569.1 2-dehydro-3-deoxy-6-phosphogalactonate aldolase [Paraglaciecola arctica]